MRSFVFKLFLFIFLFAGTSVSAQKTFTLSGTITDSTGTPQKAATVFLSGTKRITASNSKGEFRFEGMPAGTYQLSVKLIGFAGYSQNVIVGNKGINITVVLKPKVENLHEIVIGDKKPNYMNMFRHAFLGTTQNAFSCAILNPEVIAFYYDKPSGVLTVETKDLLIIENKNLGYRIKYLLKEFTYNSHDQTVIYDGETSFEDMEGTNGQKRTWAKNRLSTYKGSMMHFLRSAYQHTTKSEGFDVYHIYSASLGTLIGEMKTGIKIDSKPIVLDTLVTPQSDVLVSLKFNMLYITFDGDRPMRMWTAEAEKLKKTDKTKQLVTGNAIGSSVLKLVASEALIDASGRCSDYKAFYKAGKMADKRVGDQLPFEYQPVEK